MIASGITAARLLLLAVLLAGTPLLLVAAFSPPRAAWPKRLSNAGLLSVGLSLAVALGLHAAHIPISAASLATAHLSLFAIAFIATLIRHCPPDLRSLTSDLRPLTTSLLPLAILLLLLFPWTHFTGIDTYKWQDLATSVRMEQSLPWIVHPLSLLGFTPRAYPPAHPVLLATVQIVGDLGVDGGFAVVSWLIALFGVASATRLAGCFLPPRIAFAAGLLYGFSPVFMRYAHWATGRGLFLAVFPVFIALLVERGGTYLGGIGERERRRERTTSRGIPIVHRSRRRYRQPTSVVRGLQSVVCSLRSDPEVISTLAWICRAVAIGVVGTLLVLTHKVALVAVPLVLLAAIAAGCLPVRRLPVAVRIAVTLPFLLAAAAMVTPAFLPGLAGLPGGLVRTGAVRFGWMLPFALGGLWLAPSVASRLRTYAGRFGFLCALPALPLAFERQMYGALYALPFICLFAVDGFQALVERIPLTWRVWCVRTVVALTLAGALVTVGARSRIACPSPLYRAAMFLEAYDPAGPFMVHAPGMARTRVQAYVSGCARFDVFSADTAQPQWPSLPPPRRPTLRATVDAWATALRGLVTLEDTTIDWYGSPRVHYHFVIDGRGDFPPGAERIYDREGIAIFRKPATAP